ncbi:MAG TPA: peptidoglycan-binding protein LysM [Longimicrobiales bacterium]|nr:peptidoglycan-binding protein LysM [Longimicrobiales bacterium]
MGIFDFLKDVGEKVTGSDKKAAADDKAMEGAIARHVQGLGLRPDDFRVAFDDGTATINGTVATQAVRERVILAAGNVHGVSRVDDRLTVKAPAPEGKFHTVKSGDTLSKIAREHYGDAGRYPEIFEANKPMLKDPDKIYPGQVLRIPLSASPDA